MPILLFLIDTSASMNQRAYLGTSYLDIAKGAVELFMKVGPAAEAAPPPPALTCPFRSSRKDNNVFISNSAAAGQGSGQPRGQVHAGHLRRGTLLH